MGKRQEEAKKTRQKILETVKNFLIEDRKFTVEDITKQANVAKGTFYIYFKNKEEAIFEIENEKFFKISSLLLNSDNPTYERINNFLKQSALIIKEAGLDTAKQWMKTAVSPIKVSKGISKYNYDLSVIKKCIEDGINSGELKRTISIDNLATEIICEYYGTVTIWCLTNGQKDLMDLINFYCNSSLKVLINSIKEI